MNREDFLNLRVWDHVRSAEGKDGLMCSHIISAEEVPDPKNYGFGRPGGCAQSGHVKLSVMTASGLKLGMDVFDAENWEVISPFEGSLTDIRLPTKEDVKNLSNDSFMENKDWCFSPPAEEICEESTNKEGLAQSLGLSLDDLACLQTGELVIDDELAKKLAEATKGTQRLWLTKERLYREDLVRFAKKKKPDPKDAKIRQLEDDLNFIAKKYWCGRYFAGVSSPSKESDRLKKILGHRK